MREVDAETPVVWPSWCYAGGGGSDQGGGGGGTAKVRSHRRRGPASNNNHSNGPSLEITAAHINNNNNIGSPLHAAGIKSESSLSPHYNTPEWSSSRSRSVTPSSCSFPGTPPQSGAERGPSPAHPAQTGPMGQSGALGSQQPSGPLGHTASLLGQTPHALRNYSDIMRSLAAKYNNANNNDFFRASLTNGLDPLSTLKPPPLGSLLPPHPTPPPASGPSPQTPVGGIFANYSFSQGGPKTVSAFPSMLDMSSTKALLAIARVANATKDTESNSYGKGLKRSPNKDSNTLTSPLDLSSAASVFSSAAKKSRTSPKHESEPFNESGSFSGSSGDRERSPGMDMRNLSIKSDNRNGSIENMKLSCSRSDAGSPASSGRKSPGSTGRKSPLSSSGRECGNANCCRIDKRDCTTGIQEVAAWTIEDVCKFVEGIDICAEYSSIFKEQSIDGAGLPLLTEDHLTGLLKMKLGPALKLRALLAAKMNSCNHCRSHHSTTGTITNPLPTTKIERPPSAASEES